MTDGTTWSTFCLVVASKSVMWWSEEWGPLGGTYINMKKAPTCDHVTCHPHCRPTSDENYQSKGELNDLFEDMQIVRAIDKSKSCAKSR